MGSISRSILHAAHIARLLPPELRKAEGVQTAQEAQTKYLAGEEDKLQKAVRDYLNLHEIVFINPSMRRRSALPPGMTDFIFAYRGAPIAAETKAGDNDLEPDQRTMREKLIANGWRWILVRSVADLQRLFRKIDAERKATPGDLGIPELTK